MAAKNYISKVKEELNINDWFSKSEWKRLQRYMKLGVIGEPVVDFVLHTSDIDEKDYTEAAAVFLKEFLDMMTITYPKDLYIRAENILEGLDGDELSLVFKYYKKVGMLLWDNSVSKVELLQGI